MFLGYRVWHKYKCYPNGDIIYSYKSGQKILKQNTIHYGNNGHYLFNSERSARRVKSFVDDLLKVNEFKYFATLTFSSDTDIVSDRLDDLKTRELFKKWRNNIKTKFPFLTYLAIPEYHKKGGLHYHLVIGYKNLKDYGIDPDNFSLSDCLGLIFAKDVLLNYNNESKLIPCYNITAWKYGFSTATAIQSIEACSHYILKYITKAGSDPRFFSKNRYTKSQNLELPFTFSREEKTVCISDINDSMVVPGLEAIYTSSDYSCGCFRLSDISKNYIKEHNYLLVND